MTSLRTFLEIPGESPHLKILNLITSAKILFSLEGNIYRFRGGRTCYLGGGGGWR